ncbi:MAG: hypothetical protein ABI910_00745 [Gemmatimonadota bacterium]
MSSSLLLLMIVAVVLGTTVLLPRREVGHPLLEIVRVLFPSWRFFDDVQTSPALLVRVAPGGEAFGAWRMLLVPTHRSWTTIVWNPAGNLRLAEHALLDRLLADVAEWEDTTVPGPESFVSYELVLNLVRGTLSADGAVGDASRFQFKLVDAAEDSEAPDADLLISAEHTT